MYENFVDSCTVGFVDFGLELLHLVDLNSERKRTDTSDEKGSFRQKNSRC